MPTAGRFRLGPPRVLSSEGHGALLRPPGVACRPYGTGARDAGDQVDLVLQTQAQGLATLGLPIRHNPTPPLHTSRQTFPKRARRFHTLTPLAIAHADASGEAPSPPHAEPAEHLCEIVPTVCALPVGWPRCPQGLRVLRRRPRARKGRGVRMHPGCQDGLPLQRSEGDGTIPPVQMGRKQRLEEVSQPIIMARGPRAPRLQQRHPAPFCQPFPHLLEGMIAIQNREDQRCDPTPTREPRRRVGWDEAVHDGGDLQAPEPTQDPRSMCDGMPLLHCHGPAAPPVVVSSARIIAESRLRQQRASPPQPKSCGLT